MNEFEAKQVIDGALLSDASLYRTYRDHTCFRLGQWNKPPDWLKCVQRALHALGLPNERLYRYEGIYGNTGKPYVYWYLQTRVCPVYATLRNRWYIDSRKEAPEDLILAPVSLAHWFMGDGSSVWLKGSRVLVRLHTRGYSLTSIEVLERTLRQLGFGRVGRNVFKSPRLGAGIDLTIGKASDVSMFMGMIESFILPPYKYKVKRPGKKDCHEQRFPVR